MNVKETILFDAGLTLEEVRLVKAAPRLLHALEACQDTLSEFLIGVGYSVPEDRIVNNINAAQEAIDAATRPLASPLHWIVQEHENCWKLKKGPMEICISKSAVSYRQAEEMAQLLNKENGKGA